MQTHTPLFCRLLLTHTPYRGQESYPVQSHTPCLRGRSHTPLTGCDSLRVQTHTPCLQGRSHTPTG